MITDLAIDDYGELVVTDPAGLALAGPPGPIIPPMPDQSGRSPRWPAFLRDFLAEEANARCFGCHRKAVTGHHLKPFHLFPELELSAANLAPVCRPCHFVLCHGGDWRLWLPGARAALARQLDAVKHAKETP